MPDATFSPNGTPDGALPPWELAKAFAYHHVIQRMAEVLAKPAPQILGKAESEFIRMQVTVKGGGHPTERAIRKAIKRCEDPAWYPGKPYAATGGRTPTYSEFQKESVARVAQDLKRKRIAPTPRRVRARLPEVARNPESGRPMSKTTIREVFKTRCFDDGSEDPWQYQACLSQDVLPGRAMPLRVTRAKHLLKAMSATVCFSHVAIDPCYSLLAKTQDRLDQQQAGALGKKRKWMSPSAARVGMNLRPPATAKSQGAGM